MALLAYREVLQVPSDPDGSLVSNSAATSKSASTGFNGRFRLGPTSATVDSDTSIRLPAAVRATLHAGWRRRSLTAAMEIHRRVCNLELCLLYLASAPAVPGVNALTEQWPQVAASRDPPRSPIADLGVVSLGRERQVTRGVANSHSRPPAVIARLCLDVRSDW